MTGHATQLWVNHECRYMKGLENAARVRRRGQHFQARVHSFSLYGPTLSRQITFFFPTINWLTSGFTQLCHWIGRLRTIVKIKSNERTSERAINLKKHVLKNRSISLYFMKAASSSPVKCSKIVFPMWNFVQSLKLHYKDNFYQSLRITRNQTSLP